MTLNPLVHPLLLLLIGSGLVALVLVAMRAAPKDGRGMWLGRLLLVCAVLIAALRPGVGSVATNAANTELDVVFVVDLSGSAGAEDWNGSEPRLTGMRSDIEQLALRHAGARFALITFDSEAQYRLPFTTDTTALAKAMQLAQPQPSGRSNGSSIGAGAEMLQQVLNNAIDYNPERMRVVYYLGDGEITSDTTPERYRGSDDLIQGGKVFGYGTERGGRMRDSDPYSGGEYILDRSGQEGISTIDEANLQDIADDLGVEYQLRDADSEPEAADIDPARGEGATQRGGVTTFPIYWVFALVAAGWMLVECGWLVRQQRELAAAKVVSE